MTPIAAVNSLNTSTDVWCRVQQVTPAWAQTVLRSHEHAESLASRTLNRRLRPARVAQYAQAMRDGLWHLNGEPIQFAGDRLMNGQHRLHAVVASNTTIPMVVVCGISPESFHTIDQGKPRNVIDIIGERGVPFGSLLSGGAALAWNYEQHGTFDRQEVSQGVRSTTQVLAVYIEAQFDRWEAAAQAARKVYKLVASPSILCAMHYLIAPSFADAFARFMTAIETGENLSADRPVYMLRERMIRAKGAGASKPPSGVVAAWAVKAWNAEVTGEPLKMLKHSQGRDVFPTIVR